MNPSMVDKAPPHAAEKTSPSEIWIRKESIPEEDGKAQTSPSEIAQKTQTTPSKTAPDPEDERDRHYSWYFKVLKVEASYLKEVEIVRRTEDHELNKFCGAIAMLWNPILIRKWNAAVSDPSDNLYISCPLERQEYLFEQRYVKKVAVAGRRAMLSLNLWEGMGNRFSIFAMIPTPLRNSLLKDAKAFQAWSHERNVFSPDMSNREWAMCALKHLKQHLEERWP